MMRKPNFIVDADSFLLLREEIGTGRIVELSAGESSLVTPHIEQHPETIYVACSGVDLSGQFGMFRQGETQIAIEWVRKESRPQPGEPECNSHRYLFGLTNEQKCFGYDVTQPRASALTGQVADHWSTFEEMLKRHFPNE